MLDLSAIPVVDNHCHPLLLDQAMDKLLFRRYFTESSDPVLPQQHIENTVYYLWMLRQMASFYGCSNTEDAILAARNKLDGTSLVERFLRAANFDTLVLDTGLPAARRVYFAGANGSGWSLSRRQAAAPGNADAAAGGGLQRL